MNNLKEYAEEYYYKKYPVTLNIGEEGRKKVVTDIYSVLRKSPTSSVWDM